jgi:hypothetical protein
MAAACVAPPVKRLAPKLALVLLCAIPRHNRQARKRGRAYAANEFSKHPSGEEMSRTLASRALAVLLASAAAIAIAEPAAADPVDPVPGTGLFMVGPNIAPGLYHSDGPSGPLIIILGKVSEQSTCVWFTHSKPDANKDDVVETNSSMGPMYAKVPASAKAFETANCRPWTRVN